eukprot:353839-Chlamydomonas_euryale.AAC.23
MPACRVETLAAWTWSWPRCMRLTRRLTTPSSSQTSQKPTVRCLKVWRQPLGCRQPQWRHVQPPKVAVQKRAFRRAPGHAHDMPGSNASLSNCSHRRRHAGGGVAGGHVHKREDARQGVRDDGACRVRRGDAAHPGECGPRPGARQGAVGSVRQGTGVRVTSKVWPG